MQNLLEYLNDATSDKELFDVASKIVCSPKKPVTNFSDASFILHAPLAICTRYYLLPLVDDENIEDARKQIRSTAKKYFEYENAVMSHDRKTIGEFDITNVDVNRWASSLLFASHAPILLAMKQTLGETNSYIDSVLSEMLGVIDADTSAQMDWSKKSPSGGDVSPELLKHPETWFFENVGNIDHIDEPDVLIRGGVESVESAGLILPIVQTIGAIANFSDRADFDLPFRVLIRMATLCMLIENEEHSKYGWTHCLTIPHAIWSLAGLANSKGAMLQSASTHVATFRSLYADTKLDTGQLVEYFEEDEHSIFAEHHVRMTDIISQACILEDAHLVKYVYSCFDCMKRDPQYTKLYIAAASKLLSIWQTSL